MRQLKLIIAALFLISPFAASADPIALNAQIVGSEFTHTGGIITPPPVDPVILDFTIMFDNDFDVLATAVGLTINSFNLPYPLLYAYNAISDSLTVATVPVFGSCDNPPNSFCMGISRFSTANPLVTFIQQTTISPGYWIAQNINAVFSPAQPGPAPVPEPGSLALLGLGLAGIGMTRRKKKV